MQAVDHTFPCPMSADQTRRRRTHLLSLAFALVTPLLASPAAAQSISTFAIGVPGPVGAAGPNQVFLDATVSPLQGITIQSLDVDLVDPPGTPGTIRLAVLLGSYLQGTRTTNAGAWTATTATGNVVSEGPGRPSHVCFLPGGVFLPFGPNAIAVQYTGVFARAVPYPPVPVPPSFVTVDTNVGLFYGDAQNTAFGALNAGHWQFTGTIYYQVGNGVPCPNCANKVSAGLPCASPCFPFPVLHVDANFPVPGELLRIETTGASPCASLGITMIGFTPLLNTPIAFPPGTCFLHQTIDMNSLFIPFGGGWDWTLRIPTGPLFCGATFYVQSAVLEAPPSIVTSNGLTMTIGN